jgi:hypothetical protein
MIPLTGVLRATLNYVAFSDTSQTDSKFQLPSDQSIMTYRAGFRWGGKEPYLMPTLGMEISGWYECDQRTDPGSYGFLGPNNDHNLEQISQRIFGRAQINFTTLNTNHYIVLALQGGAAFNSDRLSCYRLGGVLPYTKEFPLLIPGYGHEEISAKDFGLLTAAYTWNFESSKRWSLISMASIAAVDYQEGTGQPGTINSGIGAGIGYTAPSKRWKVATLFGYGFQAERDNGRGGYSVGVAFQYNFGSTETAGDKAFEELQHSEGVR